MNGSTCFSGLLIMLQTICTGGRQLTPDPGAVRENLVKRYFSLNKQSRHCLIGVFFDAGLSEFLRKHRVAYIVSVCQLSMFN